MNYGQYVLIAYAKKPCANTAKFLEVQHPAHQGGNISALMPSQGLILWIWC